MMPRALASLLIVIPLLIAASGPVRPIEIAADQMLARARAEAATASKRLESLEAAASKAGDETARLRAEQLAAAAAIEESEAKISEADAALRLSRAQLALSEERLAKRRAPLAALLAGLVTMGRQPPLLALADGGSIEEMVRVRALLDTTMPVIERRSAALAAAVAQDRRLAVAVAQSRSDLARERAMLSERQRRFAELETASAQRTASLQLEVAGASDRVLAGGEALNEAGIDAAERRAAKASAAELASLNLAPARPVRGDSPLPAPDFAYVLPLEAPLLEGLGSVSRTGIVSRGLRFDSARGASVVVPADGKILFAAPYRGQDGVVIIEHGRGWTSLLLGVASDKPRGATVRRGEPLGRALGPVGVELRRSGRPISPALIAASSVGLSNGGESR